MTSPMESARKWDRQIEDRKAFLGHTTILSERWAYTFLWILGTQRSGSNACSMRMRASVFVRYERCAVISTIRRCALSRTMAALRSCAELYKDRDRIAYSFRQGRECAGNARGCRSGGGSGLGAVEKQSA
jgi:transposase InsO family protein